MNSKSKYEMRKESPFPLCTVDVIIEQSGRIVLIERKFPPLGWALPGGFVERGETLEHAAAREAKEETGLQLEGLKQFHAYSDPERDPRFHTISVVFTAKGIGRPAAASDAQSIRLFSRDNLPENIVFDHKKIIEDYFNN